MREEDIAEAFNRVGAAYAASAGTLLQQHAQDLVAQLELEAGQRFVDLGCGPGTLLSFAAPLLGGGEAVGIDLSYAQIAAARALFREAKVRCRFVQESAVAVSLPDRWADAAGLGFVLPYADDPVQILREAARVTRPGGRVAATVWGRPFFGRPGGRLLDVLHRRNIPVADVELDYDHRALAEQAFFCNLRDVEIHESEREIWWDDFDGWWRALFVCGLLPELEGSQLAALGDDLREDDRIVDPDGQVRARIRVWLLSAVVDR